MKLSPKFEEALVYATQAHCNQTRKKTSIPYIAHILGVTAIALEYGADETESIGALLHDVVEDCGGAPRLHEIERKFGKAVAKIVEGCTDTDETPKPPWRERKEKYIAHLRHAPASTQIVSAADKLHNLRSILKDYRTVGDKLWSRFNGGREGTLWYYAALVNAFHGKRIVPLVEELDRNLATLEAIANNGKRVKQLTSPPLPNSPNPQQV
jgi:(p)ppGpp synthase/HD superfamily hydrolase